MEILVFQRCPASFHLDFPRRADSKSIYRMVEWLFDFPAQSHHWPPCIAKFLTAVGGVLEFEVGQISSELDSTYDSFF
jgi:hypothetical protein